MTTIDTDRCLVCGAYDTCNGFLCAPCLGARIHTRHWRWLSDAYARAVRQEESGPLLPVTPARYSGQKKAA